MFYSKIMRPLILGAFLLLLFGCQDEKKEDASSQIEFTTANVTIQPVSLQTASRQREIVGTVKAINRAEIASKITGNILKMPVALGTRVKKGDLLVEVSAEEISAQLQSAKAQLEQARRNLAREENLLKQHAATQESVKSLMDTLKIAEATYKEASTMLNYTRISAPFSGIITQKIAGKGDLATPGKILLRLEDETQLEIATDVPEAMMHKITPGDTLPVAIPALNLHLEGVVTEMSPAADPNSRTAPIKLKINESNQLRSGQFARVFLSVNSETTLVVPKAAVKSFGQMDRVFVAENGHARLRLIRRGADISREDGQEFTEILSGLSENESVITDSDRPLVDGQPVKIDS